MPLIHFAFGSLHRAGEHDNQAAAFIEQILGPRTLRAFVCPEFLPILNNPNAKWADPDSARALPDGSVTYDRSVPAPPVGLLPVDVWMISFVNIPLNKLGTWSGADHYGRLGIAFTDNFVRKAGIRRVHYYQYPNLARDPAVIKLNAAIANRSPEVEQLRREIVSNRKPARLWPEINSLFAVLKITEGGPNKATQIEKLTYSRYEVGYNFEVEQEARKVLTENERDLVFDESDVLAVIVPDDKTGQAVYASMSQTWRVVPPVTTQPRAGISWGQTTLSPRLLNRES